VKVFTEISKTTNFFVLPLFMARVVFSSVMGEGSEALKALKGVVIYFVLVAGFSNILELLFSIPESFLPKFQNFEAIQSGYSKTSGFGLIPFAVDHILEVLLAGLYWVAYYLHVFFMIIMASMAPIVFVTSTLLGVGLGIEIFFGLLIIGSSWPIIWHGFDQVHQLFQAAGADEFGMKCLELIVTLLKGVCPVVFAALAVKSPAGQAVMKGAQMTGGRAMSLGEKGVAMSTRAISKTVGGLYSASGGSGGGGVMGSASTNGGGGFGVMGTHGGGVFRGAGVHGGGLVQQEGLKKVSPDDLERVIGQNLKKSPPSSGDSSS
jgi:hypothetical protein